MSLKSKLSLALHNLIANRPPKTSRLLSLFILLFISITSVAMLTVMTSGLRADLEENYITTSKQKAEGLLYAIDHHLAERRVLLAQQAQSPVLSQSAMNPQMNLGILEDFFDASLIIGNKYPQYFFDFRGQLIFPKPEAIAQVKEFHYDNQTDIARVFADIYSGARSDLLNLRENLSGERLWEFAMPVRYGNNIEALLITHIPLSEVEVETNLTKVINLGIHLELPDGKQVIWGSDQGRLHQDYVTENAEIRAHYSIDFSSLDKSFRDAQRGLILSTLVIAIIATIFAIYLGRWFFVSPLERLEGFASKLSEGQEPELLESKRITVEIQALSDQIIDMATRIQKRESALKQANLQLKQNQSTLVQAEKMAGLGQLAAGIAHEINNPVGFIMSNLGTLREYHDFLVKLTQAYQKLVDELSDSEKTGHEKSLSELQTILAEEDFEFVINDTTSILDESVEGAERVKQILAGLKGYSHSGEVHAPVDINDTVRSTIKMVWNELKYNCKLETDLNELPLFTCSGGHISQVLVNLFVNASHAMQGSSGILRVQTQYQDDKILIIVSDTGKGIEPEHLNRIFEPFFTTKAVGEGTGLGMSICYDIIKEYGGNICVDSAPGKGTTFTIALPAQVQEND